MDEQYKTEDFGSMLGESIKTLNTGDTVVGVVMDISPNEIKLDLGAKSTGVVTRDQITDDPNAKLADMFKLGDEIDVFVIKVSDVDGIATLSKKRVDASKNWKNIVAAADSKETVEGRVTEAVKGGVVMSVDGVRVFIPASQTGIPKEGDLSVLVGTTQKIKIIEVREDRKRAYGSIREYRQTERRAKEDAFWGNIHEGDVYEGPVKSLTSFGAFVDLGGVDGMVHMSELSWKHIRHPSEIVNVGDVIKVFVKSFDREKKRISLGYKTEDSDPWKIFTDKYKVGDIATVKIVSLMPFGAFAEVVPGADGLIHISQIAREKVARTADILEVGQEVDVKITDIDFDHKKISLSIRALLDDLDAFDDLEALEGHDALEEEAAPEAMAEDEAK